MSDAPATIDPAAVARVVTEAKKLAIEHGYLMGDPAGTAGERPSANRMESYRLRVGALNGAAQAASSLVCHSVLAQYGFSPEAYTRAILR